MKLQKRALDFDIKNQMCFIWLMNKGCNTKKECIVFHTRPCLLLTMETRYLR